MSLQKRKPLRSTALRDSARGEACTVRIPGICDGGGETTVLAHINVAGRHGMSTKASDTEAVYSCGPCHDYIDQRTPIDAGDGFAVALRDRQTLRAVFETHARMRELGLISVKGAK